MLKTLWNAILLKPFYNLLIVFVGVFSGNAGLAIIALTLVVKIILYPVTKKSIVSQIEMKKIEPELNRIKKDFPDKQEQAKKQFVLYKQHKINPFSSCLLVFIQLPVVIALYWAIKDFSVVANTSILYSFVHVPESISTIILGLDITKKSIILAIVVAVVQYFQLSLSQKAIIKTTSPTDVKMSTQQEIMQNMQSQMKYMMPLMIGFFTYTLPAAIGLYWFVNILTTIAQEYYIRSKYKHHD
jgi:YidC/Oxa1 family membrane protein insertase